MDSSVTRSAKQLTQIEIEEALSAAQRFARKSRSESTMRAYISDWRQFNAWCLRLGLDPLPATPETVSMFVAAQATSGISPPTLERRLCAIRLVHLSADCASPHSAASVRAVMSGIRREWKKPKAAKVPAIDEEIQKMVDTVEPSSAKELRDRALLLFGFAGAFRRSELVGLNIEDLAEQEEGFVVTVRRSKTDQEGEGHRVGILRQPGSPHCPVQAMKDWLTVAEISKGAIFRRMFVHDTIGRQRLTAQSVALVIKDYASRAELDSDRYAGHSLRSGFLTSAAQQEANIFKMADQSRHKSINSLRSYVKNQDLFNNHSAERLLNSASPGPAPDDIDRNK